MKRLFSIMLSICIVSLLHTETCAAQSASASATNRCKSPIILEVVSLGGSSQYKLNGRLFKLYPLTEMANELGGCKVERTVDVILDYHVPLSDFLGSVPSKLQAESVRYFIRTETSLVEISIVSYDAKLPQ